MVSELMYRQYYNNFYNNNKNNNSINGGNLLYTKDEYNKLYMDNYKQIDNIYMLKEIMKIV